MLYWCDSGLGKNYGTIRSWVEELCCHGNYDKHMVKVTEWSQFKDVKIHPPFSLCLTLTQGSLLEPQTSAFITFLSQHSCSQYLVNGYCCEGAVSRWWYAHTVHGLNEWHCALSAFTGCVKQSAVWWQCCQINFQTDSCIHSPVNSSKISWSRFNHVDHVVTYWTREWTVEKGFIVWFIRMKTTFGGNNIALCSSFSSKLIN